MVGITTRARAGVTTRALIGAGAGALTGALALALLAGTGAARAAAPTLAAGIADGTLEITGGSSPERIALRLSPLGAGQLLIDVGDDGSAEHSFDATELASMEELLRKLLAGLELPE